MGYFQEDVAELRSPLSLEKPQYVCRAGEFQPVFPSQPETENTAENTNNSTAPQL